MIKKKFLCVLVSFLIIGCCTTPSRRFFDIITGTNVRLKFRGNTVYKVPRIILYVDIIKRELSKHIEVPDVPVTVLPESALWWRKEDLENQWVFENTKGQFHKKGKRKLIRVEWVEDYGCFALAHEFLHAAGWSDKEIIASDIDDRAVKTAIASLRIFKKMRSEKERNKVIKEEMSKIDTGRDG